MPAFDERANPVGVIPDATPISLYGFFNPRGSARQVRAAPKDTGAAVAAALPYLSSDVPWEIRANGACDITPEAAGS